MRCRIYLCHYNQVRLYFIHCDYGVDVIWLKLAQVESTVHQAQDLCINTAFLIPHDVFILVCQCHLYLLFSFIFFII